MSDIEGFILAGGASSRMGADKATLKLGEQTFIERIAEMLAELVMHENIRIIGDRRETLRWKVVADVYKNCGALGGIHSALAHARSPWIAVVACDLPFVTGDLFRRLASLRRTTTEEFDAVVPVQPEGHLQPLCALYSRAVCYEQAEKMLQSGDARPRELLNRVRLRRVCFDKLSDLRGAELFFKNVNTPQDYIEAKKMEAES
jgi:molybdenum cofactor guanylyltransferase